LSNDLQINYFCLARRKKKDGSLAIDAVKVILHAFYTREKNGAFFSHVLYGGLYDLGSRKQGKLWRRKRRREFSKSLRIGKNSSIFGSHRKILDGTIIRFCPKRQRYNLKNFTFGNLLLTLTHYCPAMPFGNKKNM